MITDFASHPALSLFCELLELPSPPGREERMAKALAGRIEAMELSHELDGAGNLLVRLDGSEPDAPLCCIAAHMDEIAMVVTGVDADGALRVDRSGGLCPWKLGEAAVQILGDVETITGVFSMGSQHATGFGAKPVGWAEVSIITGLTADALKKAGVRPGSSAVPIREGRGPVLFGEPADPLVAAWTFDDRMGLVALLRLLQELRTRSIKPVHPTIIAFTVHEEGGAHGAKALAHKEQPEIFISIDGCPMPRGSDLLLDGRPGVWSKDKLLHYDQRLVVTLCRAAVQAGTELQPVVYDAAASDASLVYDCGGAHRVACLGHVRENSHGYEVARLSVFDNLFRTLVELVTMGRL